MVELIVFANCVCEYHMYGEIWIAAEGEMLICSREMRNREGPLAVAVLRNGYVVGHIPWSMSHVCSLFLQ